MRNLKAFARSGLPWRRAALAPVLATSLLVGAPALSQSLPPASEAKGTALEDLLNAVVRIKTVAGPDARTSDNLGRERSGSGIVIDDSGLVLTIGYLMVEAQTAEVATNDGRTVPADVLGYDHDTGFGLLRAQRPLRVRPLPLGNSGELKVRDPVLAVSFGGRAGVAPAVVISRREFAGGWEYLVDTAIFTVPPHNAWSGAALINKEGKLVGVGSLIVADTTGRGDNVPGNMYVPTDLLTPVLADLISAGRAQGIAKPWLGLTTEEVRGRLFVSRVTAGGPAARAGLKRGDVIVGVDGENAAGLADFYRKIWKQGRAGATIPLDVLQDSGVRRVEVKSADRNAYLKLKSSY